MSSWTAGRVVAVVAGTVAVLLGLAGVGGGITLTVWQSALSDDGEIVLGVAAARDAAAYLDGVEHTVRGNTFSEREVSGGAPAVPPDADIWLASASGSGPLELVLDPEPGRFVVVVMAADGEAGAHATVDVGATLPWLGAARDGGAGGRARPARPRRGGHRARRPGRLAGRERWQDLTG